jgi:hypothetical protein
MAIITSNALTNVRFDDTTDEIFQVDGNGNEISNSRFTVSADVATLIKDRATAVANEATKVANQVANVIPTGATGPQGPQGAQGSQGNHGNNGTSSKVMIPLGGIATLAQKTYDAMLPISESTSIHSMSVVCATSAPSTNISFILVKNGSDVSGTSFTLSSSTTFASYTFASPITSVSGDKLQIKVSTSVGATPPTKVTFTLTATVG